MTGKIDPHGLFEVWSADETANCLNGVGIGELYNKLMDLTIPRQNTPGLDYRELPDDFGDRCLAKSWDQLTEAEQLKLNELAVAEVGQWEVLT